MQKDSITLIFILIIAIYGMRTVARNEDWKTHQSFWRQTVLVSYNSPRAHNNMGDAYCKEGNLAGGIMEFKRAIELKPDYAEAYYNLANVYQAIGNIKEAKKLYNYAILLKPELKNKKE